MLTVVCFLWSDQDRAAQRGYAFGEHHVATLRSMLSRHLSLPHELVCVTDRTLALDVRTVPLDPTLAIAGTTYAKLQLFRPDAAVVLGERLLYVDLDVVIVDDLTPIVDRREDVVLWRNPHEDAPRGTRWQTSMILMTAGARPEVWTWFDPEMTPGAMGRRWGGHDQAWISQVLSEEARWTEADGVVVAARQLQPGARIVFFPGRQDPSQAKTQARCPWIAEHWRA